MKKILITGATGFIGANLARKLVEDGHNVSILVRPEHKKWRIKDVENALEVVEADLKSKKDVERAVSRIKPDWIFHLAAYGAYSAQDDLKSIIETNIEGTINLVEASKKAGFESFVNVGSSSEYGFKDHAPKEDEFLDPNSYYALAKAFSSMFSRHVSIKEEINIVTLRPYSVYGPFEEPSRLIPTLIRKGMEGTYPPLVNPKTARDFIYVDDFIDACVKAAEKTDHDLGAIYNVGSEVQTALLEVVEVVKNVFQIKEEPEWGTMEQKSWDTDTWVSNSAKCRETLGWYAKYSFEQGFRAFTEWYKEQDKNKDSER